MTDATIPPRELLGYWPLDETSGSVARDRSTAGRHGTCQGATFGLHDGRRAAHFDGNGSFVTIPHDDGLAIQLDITIAARLWKESPNAEERWDAVLSKTPGVWDYELLTSMAKSDELAFFSRPCGPSEVYGGLPVAAERWVHVAVTRSGDRASFYLDGQPTATASMTGRFPSNGGELQIGHDGALKNGGMRGWIADVVLYRRSLSTEEIARLAS